MCNFGLDKNSSKIKIKEQRRKPADIHPSKVHLTPSAVQKTQIRHPSLHANDLHKQANERLLVQARVHPNNINII